MSEFVVNEDRFGKARASRPAENGEKRMTNYERITNRSIYEMASEIERISNYVCDHYDSCDECPFDFSGRYDCNIMGFTDWLNSEAEE